MYGVLQVHSWYCSWLVQHSAGRRHDEIVLSIPQQGGMKMIKLAWDAGRPCIQWLPGEMPNTPNVWKQILTFFFHFTDTDHGYFENRQVLQLGCHRRMIEREVMMRYHRMMLENETVIEKRWGKLWNGLQINDVHDLNKDNEMPETKMNTGKGVHDMD